jgi:phosphoadenosine phosphosulfate reductase
MNLIDKTIERIKFYEPPEGYYLAFSGGKDSQCIYHLSKMAGVKFDAHFEVTTVDPSQLLKFIKNNYSDVIWEKPKISMFQLILKEKMLPTRIIRFCCKYLKEQGGKGRTVMLGVRWQESRKRAKYGFVRFNKGKNLVSPILDWTHNDVWKFLNDNNISHCELYDPPYNYKRIGCIFCPMSGKRMHQDVLNFPKYKNAYLYIIKKLMKQGRFADMKSPEIVFDWWISGENSKDFLLKQQANKDQQEMVFCYDN